MKRFALLMVMLTLCACADPNSTASIRPGISSDVDLDKLRPPSGKTYQFSYEQGGEQTLGTMVLTSRRLGLKRYLYRGDFIVDVEGAGNLEDGVRSVAEVFKTPGIRAMGSRVFVPVRIETDNRFRTTSSTILTGRDRQTPHDCFAVLGPCRYVLTTSDDVKVTIQSDTTEKAGVWVTTQQVVSKDVPLAVRLRREVWTYSLDRNGVMIDLFITRRGAGPTETTAFRRKTERTQS